MYSEKGVCFGTVNRGHLGFCRVNLLFNKNKYFEKTCPILRESRIHAIKKK